MSELNKKLLLFSVVHKSYLLPDVDYVIPIHAGKKISTLNLHLTGDDEGINISELNPNYCELTVIYNVWKNNKYNDITYWGLCHYRRYFCLQLHWTKFKKKKNYYLPKEKCSFEKIFTHKFEVFLNKKISQNSIIVPFPYTLYDGKKKISVKDHFCKDHSIESWLQIEAAIEALYPDYLDSFNKVSQSNQLLCFNMMIAPNQIWNYYLKWLFDILHYIEKKVIISKNIYQARVLGFIAERLQTVYFHKNSHYHIVNLPVAHIN